MAGVKRLSKVARELNVGISTIVEFLAAQGNEIDGSPNTKIDEIDVKFSTHPTWTLAMKG